MSFEMMSALPPASVILAIYESHMNQIPSFRW